MNSKAAKILAERKRYKHSAEHERKQQELSNLAVSKPSDNPNGSNLALDARKARKAQHTVNYDKRPRAVVPREWLAKPATALAEPKGRIKTHGRTDRDINSYFRNKNGDNLPKETK